MYIAGQFAEGYRTIVNQKSVNINQISTEWLAATCKLGTGILVDISLQNCIENLIEDSK